MRFNKLCIFLFACALVASTSSARSRVNGISGKPEHSARPDVSRSPGAASKSPTELDKVIDRIIRREQNEMAAFALFKPIVETYIQQLKPNRDFGTIPDMDSYFIGQADFSNEIKIHSMLKGRGLLYEMTPFPTKEWAWDPRGFAQMIYIDRRDFDREHYDFRYAGEDFLGAVRCLMFDISPKRHAEKGHFKGRIWVEDHDYTIVRFNGAYQPERVDFRGKFVIHFDSWRMNIQPDLWLPAYVFIEGVNRNPGGLPKFKAQSRFWGYSPKAAIHESEFSDIYIEPDKQIEDDSAQQDDLSPIQEQRQFDREAEDNVIDNLVQSGLIAPAGPVDKMLDTVLNNLEVTNHLDIQPEPRCRVMLTSNIELFSVGHTIVVSRGLLDVLPDESTLAVMLAQELSDAMLWKPSLSEYEFYDLLQTPTPQAMKRFSFRDSQAELAATSSRTLEILSNSPYRSNLGTAALFLKELREESKLLPHLVGPHLGNRIYPIAAIANSGVDLKPDDVEQIAALPMGSRITVDPWDDHIRMLKARPVRLESAREKMPFEITPFMPDLTRYQDLKTAAATRDDSAVGSN